jgi:hypothetical protein
MTTVTGDRHHSHSGQRSANEVRKMSWNLVEGLVLRSVVSELIEMRSLGSMPIRIDNKRLKSVIGAEPPYPKCRRSKHLGRPRLPWG